ncbi:thiamine-phosphate kinase [Aliidiomarina taiwanensis]|uniref:Thiamine-monophosphate kinase n=1 Tax=Aliidiomarina taiwanensis TaxID=946228 RepID=A0A432X1H0_9GAMM|nr:thiamine-phosphate kinase [Aliidiomarina taiwanensis]RUO40112.1 thiamine-phosphate kinase [Aliidiomarina taiwanensis]
MHTYSKEFALIAKYFQREVAGTDTRSKNNIVLGIGDDAAIVDPPEDASIAITTDTMVYGTHFDDLVPADAVGHKLVAMNLSDLAAMGAEPTWLSLAVTCPDIDEAWMSEFSRGFFELSDYYNCSLIGGDVTRGPLSFTVTAQGIVPRGKEMRRRGARPGDRIYVSGTLGDAAAALAGQQQTLPVCETQQAQLNKALFYPRPQVGLGQALRAVATSAIDLSDGLAKDLLHVLQSSNLGARVDAGALPASKILEMVLPDPSQRAQLQLTGGEDYQLCFTVPESRRGSLETIAHQLGLDITCVGVIEGEPGLRIELNNQPFSLKTAGFLHFKD